jgi:membrane protein DedA with SNARE-associated domain
MLLKEIGVPVPVPADLLIIGAGVQAAAGRYSLPELLVTLEVAAFLGCSVQFLAMRGAGRRFVFRFGRFIGLTPARLEGATARLKRRGPLAVFLGLNVPGVRAGMIIAAGLAGMRYLAFAPAMLGGTAIYYGWHIALGYLVGPTATSLLDRSNVPLLPVGAALAVLGLIGWLLLRRYRHRADGAAEPGDGLASLHAWTEAACPACLAITAYRHLHPGADEAAPAV